jgi:serine/threonine protein kinase
VLKASAKNKYRGSFYLLFDYLSFDLTGMTDKKIKLSLAQIKCIMKQLLDGLVYLHDFKNVCHRDLKGANILLSRSGLVQIADFGLARIMFPNNKAYNYTTRVVTLWYRAPELLLGFKNYNFGVDMWSIGCVFAELVTGQVLF